MGLEVGALGVASLVTTMAGAGLSAYSTYQQGQAQEAMAQRNAAIAEAAASNEAAAAAENSKRMREQSRQKLATIRARMAGSGTRISSGSALDTIGAAAVNLELQTMDLFRESDARQIQQFNNAAVTRWEGSQAAQAGKIGAFGSLLGGIASTTGMAVDFKQSGVFRSE